MPAVVYLDMLKCSAFVRFEADQFIALVYRLCHTAHFHFLAWFLVLFFITANTSSIIIINLLASSTQHLPKDMIYFKLH